MCLPRHSLVLHTTTALVGWLELKRCGLRAPGALHAEGTLSAQLELKWMWDWVSGVLCARASMEGWLELRWTWAGASLGGSCSDILGEMARTVVGTVLGCPCELP